MAGQTSRPVWCKRLIFLSCIAPFIVLGIVLLILFLPRSPKFQVVSLQVSPITFTPLEDDSSSMLMSATWNITFFARNPNKLWAIDYDDVKVSVYYKWDQLSTQGLGFFKQCENCVAFMPVTIAEPVRVKRQVMNSMANDAEDHFAVGFNVRLRGKVMVYYDRYKMKVNHALSINCDEVRVGFSPPNWTVSMLGTGKACYATALIF